MSEPPFQAGPARRVFHTLLALAGWVVFVWWWWLVFQRVGRQEVQFTLIFIAIALVVIVLLTVTWAIHNINIFRRRGPRLLAREAAPEPVHDSIGRALQMPEVPDACRTSPVVTIRIDGASKRYIAGAPGTPRDGGPRA